MAPSFSKFAVFGLAASFANTADAAIRCNAMRQDVRSWYDAGSPAPDTSPAAGGPSTSSCTAWFKGATHQAGDCKAGKCFLDVVITPDADADHSKVAPHGLLGQAWDGDNMAVFGAQDSLKGAEVTTQAMGEGAIEGVAADYEVASAFATDFKYTRFDRAGAKPRDVSKLTGLKVPRAFASTAAGAVSRAG